MFLSGWCGSITITIQRSSTFFFLLISDSYKPSIKVKKINCKNRRVILLLIMSFLIGQKVWPNTAMLLTVIRDEISEFYVFNKKYFELMNRRDIQNLLVSHPKLKALNLDCEQVHKLIIKHRVLMKNAIEQKLNLQLDFMPRGFSRSLPFNEESQNFLEFVVENFADRINDFKAALSISDEIIKNIQEEMELKGFGQFTAKEIRDILRAHKKWLLNAFKEAGKLLVS